MIENRGLLKLTGQDYQRFIGNPDLVNLLTAKSEDSEGFQVFKTNTDKEYALIPKFLSAVPGKFPDIPYQETACQWGRILEWNDTFPLKDYQKDAVEKIINLWTLKSGALLRADCGTGKTVMALNAVSKWEPSCVVVLVDQNNIAKQWMDRINQFLPGCAVSIFGGDFKDIDKAKTDGALFKIILAQSLMRRDWVDDPILCTILLVDEAHVFSAPCFAGSIMNINFGYSLALTATPERKDKLDWVFSSILGDQRVDVAAASNLADVYVIEVPEFKDTINRYRVWWCKREKRSTWEHKCTGCHLWHLYPECGGKLRPTDRTILIDLIKTFVGNEEYDKVLKSAITMTVKKKRQIMVFSHLREHLKSLYSWACDQFGEANVGIYMGTARKADKDKRDVAMSRQLTFCTYGIANKALDVPHKDAAIFATPISDIRQAKGRVERFYKNKPVPVIIDFSVPNVDIFRGMFMRRIKTYKQSGNPTHFKVKKNHEN